MTSRAVSMVDQPVSRVGRDAPGGPVLSGGDAEVGRLDPQGGVVGHDRGRAPLRLPEGGTDDAVVGARRIEPVLHEKVLADPVDLDLQAAFAEWHRFGEGAAVAHAQLLDRAQRGAGGPPDVVRTGLQPVELLDDRERDHDVAVVERRDARGVGDEHGRVEDDSGAPGGARLLALLTSDRDESGGQEIGHRHSLGWMQGRGRAVRNGALLYRSGGARWWMAGGAAR